MVRSVARQRSLPLPMFVLVLCGPGAHWRVPLDLGDTLEVHTVYRQALHATHARYIVSTTQSWGRPLSRARFEIYLPEGAEPRSFSFPFELWDSLDHRRDASPNKRET